MYVKAVIHPKVMASYVWHYALFFAAYDVGVTALYEAGHTVIALPFTPVGTLGMAVAIVVGFHNNSAYDRWCAAHTAWQRITAGSRSFATSALGLLPDDPLAPRLVRRRLAAVKALRNTLRDEPAATGLADLLPPGELLADGPDALVLPRLAAATVADLAVARRDDRLSDEEVALLIEHEDTLQELAVDCVAKKCTPFPRQYGFVTRVFVWVFVLLLPMGFLAELGWGTPPLSLLLSITFVTLEQVGRMTENPFAQHMNDVPVDAMATAIERELKGLLGDPMPPAAAPVDGVLM